MAFSETSWESYIACKNEGLLVKNQMVILNYLHRHDKEEGICIREISRAYRDVNASYSSQFITLERHNLIVKVGKIRDPYTNRNVFAYRLTGKLPKKKTLARKFRKICPHCKREVKQLINTGWYGNNGRQ